MTEIELKLAIKKRVREVVDLFDLLLRHQPESGSIRGLLNDANVLAAMIDAAGWPERGGE